MSDTILTILIGVLGTALGAFIPSLFNFLSQKEQHKIFIKQFRAERAFKACEELISHILFAEIGNYEQINSKSVYINHLLKDKKRFVHWFGTFIKLWHEKQYLLDKESKESCQKLHAYLYGLTDAHPEIIQPQSSLSLHPDELQLRSKEFYDLLFVAHTSLQEFLKHGIEDE